MEGFPAFLNSSHLTISIPSPPDPRVRCLQTTELPSISHPRAVLESVVQSTQLACPASSLNVANLSLDKSTFSGGLSTLALFLRRILAVLPQLMMKSLHFARSGLAKRSEEHTSE